MTMLPGARALAVARRWFNEATVARVFDPLVADWQHDAAAVSGFARRRANISGCLAFAIAFVAAYPRVLREPAPHVVTRRLWIRVSAFCAILTVFASIPLFNELIRPLWASHVNVALLPPLVLLPVISVVTAFLPFAMAVAVDAVRCHEAWPDDVERRIVARVVLGVTLWMFVGGGWVIPALNHEWRAAVVSAAGGTGPMPRAVPDRTTSDLLFVPTISPTLGTRSTAPIRSDNAAVRAELAMRLSLVALPGLVAWLRWRALDIGNQRLPFKVIVVAAVAGTILGRQMEWQSGLPYFLPIRHFALWSTVLIGAFALRPRRVFTRRASARG